MTTFMIIGDGMADLPLSELNGLTPLEAANCKNMARLSSIGRSGMLDPLSPGMVAESEEAIMNLLGYSTVSTQFTRGPIEAIGADLELHADDLAFRCNFATADENLEIIHERADTSRIDCSQFAESLRDYCLRTWGLEIQFKRTWQFKTVLILRGDNLSEEVITPIPLKGAKSLRASAEVENPNAKKTAEIINAIICESKKLLSRDPAATSYRENNPANILIPWGIGKRFSIESFQSKQGLSATCIAGASLVRGIGKLCKMTVPFVYGATGGIDTDTDAKAKATLESFKDNDLLLLHIGGPDEASHDGDISSKIMIIKKIDSMIGNILDNVDLKENIIALLADHTTSTALRIHTHHPPPIVIAGGNITPDEVTEYSEREAATGSLGRISGVRLLPILQRHRN